VWRDFARLLAFTLVTMDYKDGSHKVAADEKPAHSPVYDSGSGDVVTSERPSLMTRLGLSAESFKRKPQTDEHNNLNKTMKTRHLHMIAIGGSIGAGLFVSSGGALRTGGPGALLICFLIIGVVCYE